MPTSIRAKDGGKIPGPADVPSVIEIVCSGQLPNQKRWHFAFHGAYTAVPPNLQSTADALFSAISSAWSTHLATLMHTQTTFANVSIRDMTTHVNPIYVSVGTAVNGTSPSPAMPPENAIVLTENVNVRGRGAKGRVYISGWTTDADASAGLISAATQDAVNQFGTAVQNAINAQSLVPCIAQVARQQYQGLTGSVHPSRGATHASVTSYVCQDLQWDTQRRRGS